MAILDADVGPDCELTPILSPSTPEALFLAGSQDQSLCSRIIREAAKKMMSGLTAPPTTLSDIPNTL